MPRQNIKTGWVGGWVGVMRGQMRCARGEAFECQIMVLDMGGRIGNLMICTGWRSFIPTLPRYITPIQGPADGFENIVMHF